MTDHDDKKRADDVLGIRDVTPDRPADERVASERGGVGPAGEVERLSDRPSANRPKGATGIDMGAGGAGTDIEP